MGFGFWFLPSIHSYILARQFARIHRNKFDFSQDLQDIDHDDVAEPMRLIEVCCVSFRSFSFSEQYFVSLFVFFFFFFLELAYDMYLPSDTQSILNA
jgi:hypothetical protein